MCRTLKREPFVTANINSYWKTKLTLKVIFHQDVLKLFSSWYNICRN